MQIRKFEAVDMQQALAAIRKEMGPDAVILSSRELRKNGWSGMFAPAGVEVMVAVDSPAVTAPHVASQTVFQTPHPSWLASAQGLPNTSNNPGSPNSGWSGQDRHRGNGADRGGFEAVLEEMVVQPSGLSGVAVDSLYEELREIKESIGALRLKVASASAHSNDAPLHDELRAIKESLGALRVKIASQAARSDDAALHDELHAIREAVGAVRMKMAGLGAPSEELYDALRQMNESMALLSKRESNRKIDLPPDAPIYDDLRGLRASLQQIAAHRTVELPAHSPVYDALQAIHTSIQTLSQQVAKGSERTQARPVELPADSPVYDTLRGIHGSIQALSQQVTQGSERAQARPAELPANAPIYDQLRAIQTSLSALPAREIVTVEGAGEADNRLVYDALSELQAAVRTLHMEMQKGEGADARLREQDDLRAIQKSLQDVQEMQDRLAGHGRSQEARAVQTASELSALRKGLSEAMEGWGEVAQQMPTATGQATVAAGLGRLGTELQGVRDLLESAAADRQGLREAIGNWGSVAQQMPSVAGQEAVVARLGDLGTELQGIRDLLLETAADRATAPPHDAVSGSPSGAGSGPLPDALQDELRRIRVGIEAMSASQAGASSEVWMSVVHELREVKGAVAALQEKDAAPTALPIEVAEEFGHIKQAMGVLQSSLSEMADSRLLGIQKTHEEMRDLRATMETQRYRGELSTLRPILARFFDQLLAGGMPSETAIDLFRQMKGKLPHDDLWKDDAVRKALKEVVAGSMQVTGPLQVADGTTKVVFLIGSPGAGKSLTLAKWAARQGVGEAAGKVSVVSLSSAPSSARASEGVAALSASLKGAGLEIAVGEGERGLQQAVALRRGGEVIFVEATDDTGGIDAGKMAAFGALSGVGVEVHGVLSAATSRSDQAAAVARLASLAIPLDGVVVTQIDAAQSVGPILHAAKEKGWPISYLTTGVRVPEDLEVATPERLAEILVDREVRIDLAEGVVAPSSASGKAMPRVVAVTSGKGGVGKTNVVANLAMAFSNLGKRVLVIDADLGLGNLDVLFGVVPQYTLEHVLAGQRSIAEVLVPGPGKIMILPTASGASHLGDLTSEQKMTLLSALDRLEGEADVFLIDTGAGISSTVLYFNTAAQDIVLVVTPEPTSLADAYAMMKILSKQHNERHFDLIVNMVKGDAEAQEVVRKLTLVSEQFLGVSIDFIGAVPFDDYLRMSVCQQKAVVDLYPNARSSQSFAKMAKKILAQPVADGPKGSLQFLWRRLLSKSV